MPKDVSNEYLARSEVAGINITRWRARAAKAHTQQERVKVLRDFLTNLPQQNFDMRQWAVQKQSDKLIYAGPEPDCGTMACVAGWTSYLSGMGDFRTGGTIAKSAASWLGLDDEQSDRMFVPGILGEDTGKVCLGNATTKDAVTMLDRFIRTGKIVWRKTHA
jgi:hypothetical protein